MKLVKTGSQMLCALRIGLGSLALLQMSVGPTLAAAASSRGDGGYTQSPIKDLIAIIGENRSFDHVFATYEPARGQKVWNLLSEEIVKRDGTPGRKFYTAEQHAASDPATDAFLLSPAKKAFPKDVLPAPLVGGPKKAESYIPGNSLSVAEASENGLPASYYQFLIGGGTLLAPATPAGRITAGNPRPAGPFQLTNGDTFVYDSYAASPVHRFYQMWQQLDCSLEHATPERPSGCDASLFSWVEVTVGAGTNGLLQPLTFSTEYSPDAVTTGEGSTALGFYNVQDGDAPYFKGLADQYAMSDNFHQSVNGGTGANHIMLGHGDAIWFSDGNGNPEVPALNVAVTTNPAGFGGTGTIDSIENPNPQAGTNNFYAQDGFGEDFNAGFPASEFDKTQSN